MIKTLTTAATGLQAQQSNIERISNDMANVNTDGYKKSRTEFHDLMYETIKEPGAALGAGSVSPVGIQKGLGVKVGATHKIHTPGPARMTYHPYDLMIDGNGMFPVQVPTGEILYTRNGAFHIDGQGRLQLANGALIAPPVTIPQQAMSFNVTPQGEVAVTLPGGERAVIGQIQLVAFQNEQGLSSKGSGLYQPSASSGQPIQGVPGENGLGFIQQGALEGSNVNIANSMVDMISTQRAYEMGTKVMRTADQMMESTVNIK